MVTIHGDGVHQRVVMGNVYLFKRNAIVIPNDGAIDVDREVQRFQQASDYSLRLVQYLYTRALTKTSRSNTRMFKTYLALLEDDACAQSVIDMITNEGMSAECAVSRTGERFAEIFSAIENEYMNAQAIDVKDVANILLATLQNRFVEVPIMRGRVVLAEDMLPSEVMGLGFGRVSALVVANATVDSYVAAVAKTMCIPTIVGINEPLMEASYASRLAIVDGYSGTVYIDPTESTLVDITHMVASSVE